MKRNEKAREIIRKANVPAAYIEEYIKDLNQVSEFALDPVSVFKDMLTRDITYNQVIINDLNAQLDYTDQLLTVIEEAYDLVTRDSDENSDTRMILVREKLADTLTKFIKEKLAEALGE